MNSWRHSLMEYLCDFNTTLPGTIRGFFLAFLPKLHQDAVQNPRLCWVNEHWHFSRKISFWNFSHNYFLGFLDFLIDFPNPIFLLAFLHFLKEFLKVNLWALRYWSCNLSWFLWRFFFDYNHQVAFIGPPPNMSNLFISSSMFLNIFRGFSSSTRACINEHESSFPMGLLLQLCCIIV